MSLEDSDDILEEFYRKYINPRETDFNEEISCPGCGSEDIDHSRGYRGEYACKGCGRTWRR